MKLSEKLIAEVVDLAAASEIEPASLLAVIEVESAGRIFARVEGRNEPVIRFEGHYFHRLLRGEQRARAVAKGLASPRAGAVRNPSGQTARWALLRRASRINRIAAYSSCSWGVGQVMGSHWQWLGYGSVDALVSEARSGFAGQIRLMLRFIDKSGLRSALVHRDWAAFARGYNGSGYRRNRYDSKLSLAHGRWLKRLRRGDLDGRTPCRSLSEGEIGLGSRGPAIAALQRQLSKAGYLLKPDGVFGLVSERVMRQFQRDHLLPETGIVGPQERALLEGHILAKAKDTLRKASANLSRKTGVKRGSPVEAFLSFLRRFA